MGLGVLFARVVRIGGGHEGDFQVARELADAVVDRELLLECVRLHLQIKAVPEDVLELLRLAPRFVHVAAADGPGHRASHAGGQRDDAFVALAEELLVDARVVIEPFGKRLGGEVAQVSITGVVHGQQHQVVADALFLALPALGAGDVGLEADDRLDAVLLGLLVEVDDAKHVAVVGHRDRLHAGVRARLHQIGQADGAIEQAVERVQMEMREVGGHRAG